MYKRNVDMCNNKHGRNGSLITQKFNIDTKTSSLTCFVDSPLSPGISAIRTKFSLVHRLKNFSCIKEKNN